MTHNVVIYRSPAGVGRRLLCAPTNWHAAHWISVHEPCSIRDVEILCFLPVKWAHRVSGRIYVSVPVRNEASVPTSG